MRNFTILIISVLLFSACRKRDIHVVQLPSTDSAMTPVKRTLIGTWSSGNPTNMVHIFTETTVSWNGNAPNQYYTSNDSIFLAIPNRPVTFFTRYKLSERNDSLTIYRAGTAGKPVAIQYSRIN